MTEKYGSGRALLLGHGIPQAVPFTLDPAAYAGALVYGTDGRLYQSDGAAWVLNIGRQLYDAAAPNATVPVLRVEPDAAQNAATNIDAALIPRGTGALIAAVPDNTATGGNKRGVGAVDLQRARSAASQVASGQQSVIGGGSANTASGTHATVGGGTNNDASGASSTIGGGGDNIASDIYATVGGGLINTASGIYATVGGGLINTASGVYATVGGGRDNTASGDYSVIPGGDGNTASDSYATVGGGEDNTASGDYSVIPGGYRATTRELYGRYSFASGRFSLLGDAQYGLNVLRRETTNATQSGLGSNGAAPASDNIPILPNNSLYTFRIRVSCIQTGGTAGAAGDCKAWDVVGAIKRGANAAATALLGTPTITVVGADTNLGANNATGAIIAVAANTTLGGLVINVTGQTNKNLRWVATVETTEVTY